MRIVLRESPAVFAVKERWRALDLLRFVAVVLMVQGHTFAALLEPAIRRDPSLLWHDYLHGLTAPLFFFASGVAFGTATLKHWALHTTWGLPVTKRLTRYGWLLFIGYMLSLPDLSFRSLFGPRSHEAALAFFRVDALQHIAVSLIIVEGLLLGLKRKRPFAWSVTIVGAILVLTAPSVWRLPVEDWLALPFAAYVNIDTGSIFPLFPWMGFICAGVIAAGLSFDESDKTLKPHIALRYAATGLALWSVADVLQRSGINPFGAHDYWKVSPIFFGTRLGWVLMGFALLCALESASRWWAGRRGSLSAAATGSLLRTIGQETLGVYVFHLLLLYGSPFFVGLTGGYAHSLDVLEASWVAVLLLVVSVVLALLWARARRQWPIGFSRFRVALALLVVAIALVR